MATYSSSRRAWSILYIVCGLLIVSALLGLFHTTDTKSHLTNAITKGNKPLLQSEVLGDTDPLLTGHAIAPKLGNETAKAELGRAAWKLFHTTFARFPDKPTKEESAALKSYIHLFQRLYPCGECAGHFGKILEKYPPQVSSRSAAAAWGCHVHNQVNKSLKKELFDCTKIGDFYDCGCAGEEEMDEKESSKAKAEDHNDMKRES